MKITKEQFKKIVKEVLTEENEYQAFFQKALDKAGKSIPSMSDEEKKAFFDKIDAAWNGKGEKNEELVGGQKELDVDGDGDISSDDLADLRAGKKADESVNEAETQKIVKDEDAKKSFMKHLEMNNKSIQKMADFHKVTPDRIVKGLEKFIRILHIEAPNGKPTVFSISLKLKEPKSKVSVNDGFVYDENGKQYKYNGPF
jgi:Ca2+-binding EF-hand superfamily protein